MLASPPLTLINGADAVLIELIRRLAQRSPDPEIAMVLSRQGRLTPDRSAVHRRAGRRGRRAREHPRRHENQTRRRRGCRSTTRLSSSAFAGRPSGAGLLRDCLQPSRPRRTLLGALGLTLEVRGRFVPEVPGDYVKFETRAGNSASLARPCSTKFAPAGTTPSSSCRESAAGAASDPSQRAKRLQGTELT